MNGIAELTKREEYGAEEEIGRDCDLALQMKKNIREKCAKHS